MKSEELRVCDAKASPQGEGKIKFLLFTFNYSLIDYINPKICGCQIKTALLIKKLQSGKILLFERSVRF